MTAVVSEPVHGPDLGGRRLALNIGVTLLGYAATGVVVIVISPKIIHGLGVERYGLLALMLAVVGYVRQDFGIGWSTTRAVAAALGRGDTRSVPTIVWTAFVCGLGLAAGLGLLLFGLTPILVGWVLNLSPAMKDEARRILLVSSVAIGIPILTEPLRGVLAAYQRFPVLNAFKVVTSLATSTILVVGARRGATLPAMVGAIAVKDTVMLLAHAQVLRTIVTVRAVNWIPDRAVVRQLSAFGGWLTLYQMARLAIQYVELPVIGAVLTVTAVGYYAAPSQLVGMLSVLPSAVSEVTFPAYCALHAAGSTRFQDIFRRVLKYQTTLVGLIAILLFTFADDILKLWLGSGFTVSAPVLRLQAVTFMLTAIAGVLMAALNGAGLVHHTAVVLVCLAPIQILLTYVLTRWGGITGTASAGVVMQLGAVLCYAIACARGGVVDVRAVVSRRAVPYLALAAIGSVAVIRMKTSDLLPAGSWIALAVVMGGIYAGVSWLWVMTREDQIAAREMGTVAFARVGQAFGRQAIG